MYYSQASQGKPGHLALIGRAYKEEGSYKEALTKGILPVVRVTDKLMQAKSLNAEECQDLKKLGLQAMSLLTHASYKINMQRHLLLRPDIGKEYSALCSSRLPFTDFLSGDDLQKHLKDIGNQNKIGAKITPNN